MEGCPRWLRTNAAPRLGALCPMVHSPTDVSPSLPHAWVMTMSRLPWDWEEQGTRHSFRSCFTGQFSLNSGVGDLSVFLFGKIIFHLKPVLEEYHRANKNIYVLNL